MKVLTNVGLGFGRADFP